ncbi:sulfite exporter TauE/SafE family protein [Streptomyces sp. NPDC046900]|uniref:sulfite exporter TauE/SafE family protein n=1 Tax=Streptomyces sp. NPDC046900 TaxID=3155473 RepID=UPI0033C7C232
MSGTTIPLLVGLGLFGLVGGVGITAIGPGGVLPTIGLFALTGLSPAQVAGTAIVTHIATGALGSAAYTRSGQLRESATRPTAVTLAVTALVGTPAGVLINSMVSKGAFGVILGLFVAVVAALVWWRECRERRGRVAASPTHPPMTVVTVLGLGVATAAGIVGIGGPMLTVPLLVALGIPVLEALAAAQPQSVVIASIGTLGYVAHGTVNWRLAALVGTPELAGVLLGWKIARVLPTRRLKGALILTLLALASYLALHS